MAGWRHRRPVSAPRARARWATGAAPAIAVLVAGASVVASCSSTPDPGPAPTAVDTVAPPVATTPALDPLPHVSVTITSTGDRTELRVDAPTPTPAGLVHLSVRNDVQGDADRAGRGLVVVDVATGSSRAELEAALVSAPERVDQLAVALGGAAPLTTGASQEVVVALGAGRHYLAATGPGPVGSVASSALTGAPLTTLDAIATPGTVDPTTEPTTEPLPGPTAPPGTITLGTAVPPAAVAGQAELVASATVGEIVLSDYDAELPDDLRPGWYHVVNRGPQPHQLAIVVIEEGRTGGEVIDALEQEALADRPLGTVPPGSVPPGSAPDPSDPAPDVTATTAPPADARSPVPARLRGGLASLSPGAEAWVHLDLRPGAYLAICDRPALLADSGQSRPDGLPHHTHGMAVFFRVD